jgi:hypothetical protein
MHFVLFTDHTVKQCTSAINERLQTKGTKTRPELDGWIEKGGRFSLAVTSKVARRFSRTTRLSGKAVKEGGSTVIRGHVSGGIGPEGLRMLFAGLVIVVVVLFVSANQMIGFLTVIAGAFAYVPLRGDYVNSEILLIEVEKTLRASPTPPKNPTK